MRCVTCCVLLAVIATALAQYSGDRCSTTQGVAGVCRNIRNCPSAIQDIRNRITPKTCGFEGSDPVVCCAGSDPAATVLTPKPVATTTPKPVATTTRRTSSTTEYVPTTVVYEDINTGGGTCQPVSPSLTAPKTGQKAWDKCIEYQERYVYPCEREASLSGELARAAHCHHKADELIIGGTNADRAEFPHQVLLGFGPADSIQWQCGGSIISERFILTAGHCTFSRDFGDVTHAMIGILRRTEVRTGDNQYRVGRIIKHPQYAPPTKYNDIALLQTETIMKLSQYTVPACVDVGLGAELSRALVTGWGAVEYRGDNADIMQKVIIEKFSDADCKQKFPSERLMKQGFNVTSQLCYGDRLQSRDTCQGDSGGPLQVKNFRLHCMYTVVGVTSFGRACGFIGEPGIYTRVENYVGWIESVVWP